MQVLALVLALALALTLALALALALALTLALTTSEVCGSYVEAPPTKDSSSEAASLPASPSDGGASVSRLSLARSCSRAWLGLGLGLGLALGRGLGLGVGLGSE